MLKSWKTWLNVVTIIALIALIAASRHQIVDAFSELLELNYFWLLMIIPLQIGGYSATAMYYKTYLRNLGEEVRFIHLFKVALEMNFVNNVFPSGGVSGFGYFAMRMKKEGVPASKATLTQVMRHTLTFMSFIVYLSFALLILSLFGNANRFMIMASTVIISGILTVTAILFYIITSSKRIKAFIAFLPNAVNGFFNLFKHTKKPTINIKKIEDLFEQLHQDYQAIHSNWRALKKPFTYTLLMNLTELFTIMVVYFAFGKTVNFGALIIAYAVANIAGLLAVLPGGVGVYEGLMTAVLTSAGIANALALSATLVYRVLNMAIFLPIGFVLYQIGMRKGDIEPQKASRKS